MRAPNVGFPQMVENDGELEGLYRFFGGGRASPKGVLAPHISATLERMRQVRGPCAGGP
jgi:hypothetical protein